MTVIKRIIKYLDKKLLLLIVGFYTAFTIFSLAKMIYFKSIGDRFTSTSWSYMFFKMHLLDYILVIFFMSIVLVITKYMVEKKMKWMVIFSIHLVLSLLLGFFIFYGILILQTLIGTPSASNITFEKVIYAYMNVIDLNFLVYFSIVGIMHTYYYLTKVNESEIQKVYLKDRLLQTKIKMLQSQIKPHFLFNTLHSIYSLMDGDKKKSQNMLTDLSELLRGIIDHKDENLITLQEELQLLDKYFRITKIRFSDDLIINLNIGGNLDNALVPNMLLQPIVENSIKHGYTLGKTVFTIEVSILKKQNSLIFTIKNNGKPLTNPLDKIVEEGTGITNIIERLKILYNTNYSFNVFNNELGVTTEISIPYKIAKYTLLN